MKVKILAEGRFVVSSILDNGICPVTDNSLSTDSNFESHYLGLLAIIERIAESGYSNITSSMSRCVNNEPKILELRRGQLRIFYFHGPENKLVVCTELIAKKTQKVDKKSVKKAISAYRNYYHSLRTKTLRTQGVDDES